MESSTSGSDFNPGPNALNTDPPSVSLKKLNPNPDPTPKKIALSFFAQCFYIHKQ